MCVDQARVQYVQAASLAGAGAELQRVCVIPLRASTADRGRGACSRADLAGVAVDHRPIGNVQRAIAAIANGQSRLDIPLRAGAHYVQAVIAFEIDSHIAVEAVDNLALANAAGGGKGGREGHEQAQ